MTVFSGGGTFSGGQFTSEDGNFSRYNLVRRPPITPGPEPTSGPQPTPEPVIFYQGTYSLTNGERGNFILLDGRDADSDFGFGSPPIASNLTFAFPPIQNGTANISVRVSGSTGSGSVRLSNGVTGTINITGRQVFSSRQRALKSLGLSAKVLRR